MVCGLGLTVSPESSPELQLSWDMGSAADDKPAYLGINYKNWIAVKEINLSYYVSLLFTPLTHYSNLN